MRPPYVIFSTRGNFNEVFEEAKKMRDAARQEEVKARLRGLEISGYNAEKIREGVESRYMVRNKGEAIPFNQEEDDRRISLTLESLFNAGEGFNFIVSPKPETSSCEKASKHRPNLPIIFAKSRQLAEEESKETWIEDGIGAPTDREVKSVLYKNGKGEVFYVIMPGNEELSGKVIGNKGIVGKGGFLELADCGLVPYTANPGTAKAALEEYQNRNTSRLRGEVNVFVHRNLKYSPDLTNNLGSRFLSVATTGDHFEKTISGLYPEHHTYQNEEDLIEQIRELKNIREEENKKNSEAKDGRGEAKKGRGRDRKNSGRSEGSIDEQDQKNSKAESKGNEGEMVPGRTPAPTSFHQPVKTNEVSIEK